MVHKPHVLAESPYTHWFDELPRNTRNNLLPQLHLCRLVQPVSVQRQRDILPVRGVLEGDLGLGAHELEFALDLEAVAGGRFGEEGFVEGEELGAEGVLFVC